MSTQEIKKAAPYRVIKFLDGLGELTYEELSNFADLMRLHFSVDGETLSDTDERDIIARALLAARVAWLS